MLLQVDNHRESWEIRDDHSPHPNHRRTMLKLTKKYVWIKNLIRKLFYSLIPTFVWGTESFVTTLSRWALESDQHPTSGWHNWFRQTRIATEATCIHQSLNWSCHHSNAVSSCSSYFTAYQVKETYANSHRESPHSPAYSFHPWTHPVRLCSEECARRE